MIPLGQQQHLGYRAFVLMFIRNILPALGIFIIANFASGFSDFIFQSILQSLSLSGQLSPDSVPRVGSILINVIFGLYIFSFLTFIAGYVITQLTYRFYTFTLEEFDLRLKKGIFNLETVSIPYRQIQDVNINRSLFFRILGLSKIIIDSAGHEETDEMNETDIILEPIDKDVAEEIRQLLQRKIGVQITEKESEADEDMRQANAFTKNNDSYPQ